MPAGSGGVVEWAGGTYFGRRTQEPDAEMQSALAPDGEVRCGIGPALEPRRFTSMGARLFDLNPVQQQAVLHDEGPILILAGAGTGKTRVITTRIVRLLYDGIDPSAILGVTFTNKAANEMRERLLTMFDPEQARKVTLCTFHSLCVRILRQGIDLLGYKKNFTIFDEGETMGLIKRIITRTAAQDEKLEPNVARSMISKAKNSSWNPQVDTKTLLGAVYARYESELKTLNAVDFDDLLILAVRLLREFPEKREQMQERYQHLLVDEFQDTNLLQLELMTLLAGKRSNVCAVGDDDQSIYGWRGAEVTNILEFESHFPGARVLKLEQNYRSTDAVLQTANAIIKGNVRRRAKQLWSDQGKGERVRVVEMPDDRKESSFVCEEIHHLHQTKQTPLEDFAVLFRTNAQSRGFEEECRRLKLPYRIIGGISFFERREVKDFLAYLQAVANPSDDIHLLRALQVPARGVGQTTVQRALNESIQREVGVIEVFEDLAFRSNCTKRTAGALEMFTDCIRRFEGLFHQPMADLGKLTRELLDESGFFEELRRSCKTEEEADNRERNVRDLIGDLEKYTLKKKGDLAKFLDDISLGDRDTDDTQGNGVTLITLHAAKGLEFPQVYLVGVEEGILPHDRSKMEGSLDEERRLLYVGITRAMKMLTISYCQGRVRYGSAMPCQPSSFLKELPDDHIERTDFHEIRNRQMAPEDVDAGFANFKAFLSGLEG